MSSVSLKWLENMTFEGDINGHKIIMDASESAGGNNNGATPKPFMLLALAGCTGIDVVSILKKMRVQLKDINISVDGDLSEDHPKQYIKMHIKYEFWGKDLPMDKLEKAVKLSEERYCGVSAVYRKIMPVTTEIVVYDV